MLKQISATATETATEDQASDHSSQSNVRRSEFELNITEEPPTPDQLQTIMDDVGKHGIPSLIKGAKTPTEALKRLRDDSDSFQRPVVSTVFPNACKASRLHLS